MCREQRNSVILIVTLAVLLLKGSQQKLFQNREITFLNNYNNTWVSSDADAEDGFTIQTPTCLIPNLNFMDHTIRKFIQYPEDAPKCKNSENPLLKANQTHIIILNENIHHFVNTSETELSCCYSGIEMYSKWKDYSKAKIRYEPCVMFNNAITVIHEFVRVTCNVDYEQYFFFPPIKPITPTEAKFSEAPEVGSAYNILILGLSSVSRLNFRRTMPNTFKLLKSKEVIDMVGYNKLSDDGLLYDMLAMFTGMDKKWLYKNCLKHTIASVDKCPFVWQRFKDIGYYTAFVQDSAKLGSIFNSKPVDYYVYPIVKHIEKVKHKDKSRICMGSKYNFQVMLDYVENLQTTVNKHNFFYVYWESSITEKHINYPTLMDRSYENFFKSLDKSGRLNDTIIFFVSDQGIQYGNISMTKQGRLEERLPFLKILLPLSFRQQYNLAYENLKVNSFRLTTPYDLFNTLIDLVDLNAINNEEVSLRSEITSIKDKGYSLFLHIPANRTCNTAGIHSHYCTCLGSKSLPKNSEKARGVSAFLMKQVNDMLSPYSQCSPLKVDETVEAMELMSQYEDGHEPEWQDIAVAVLAAPGGGLFKGVVRYYHLAPAPPSWALISSVRRVNAPEHLGHCLQNLQLKPFCYCNPA